MKRNTFNMVICYQTCSFSATCRNSLTSSKWMVPLTSLPLGNRTQTAFSPGILLSSSNQRVLEYGAKNSQCTFNAFESVSKQRSEPCDLLVSSKRHMGNDHFEISQIFQFWVKQFQKKRGKIAVSLTLIWEKGLR